jgi:glucan 1,4-alpha-glucosidase
MRRTVLVGLAAAAVALAGGTQLPSTAAGPGGEAPGAPGDASSWTTGAKQGVGTSTTTASKVWHSLAEGVLTEVYYPMVDVANVQDLQLIVTDGETFSDLERDATTHRVRLLDAEALSYRQVNTDKDGRYRITKTYVTDPARSTVLVDVRVDSLDGGAYTAYVLYNPSLANSGLHDSAWSDGGSLLAEDTSGEADVASALVAEPAFGAVSNGFSAASDGWTDLRDDHTLDWAYDTATGGNVVQVGELTRTGSRSTRATIALGFGAYADQAWSAANGSLRQPYDRVRRAYERGWHRYLDSLDRAPKSVRKGLRTQYNVAVMTLAAHEDKTYRGANIASLTVPWGQAINADEPGIGGYHLVWARDLYQVATAMLAAGDRAAAERSLDYLFEVQQKPDGSFPQNSQLDGTPYWGGLQLDEVAFPIVLAGQLGRTDAETWRQHVKKAADFLVANGPSTPQERWEEEGGYSPSTIAAEIAGLIVAADLARSNGDEASAALYTGVADQWQRMVDDWTYTTTGPHGDGSYFLRIDDNGDPNDGHVLEINNGGGSYDERSIVDAGFLDLVRLGVYAPDDPKVVGSLPEVDATIKVDTPHGPMWYRYNHDGYGEKADGAPYDGTGVGRLWPLLTGERGEYALAAQAEKLSGAYRAGARHAPDNSVAARHLRTMAAAANEGYLIPEQVWDRADGAGPENGAFEFGEGTGSATPLAWSMAQFVRLAHSIDAGAPVETPAVVAERYARGSLPDGPPLTLTAPEDGSTTDAATTTVTGQTDGVEAYVHAGGETTPIELASDGSFSVEVPLTLGRNAVTVVAVGPDGGTSMARRVVTSTNFGTPIGTVADPSGDDNGPGSYVYPTNAAFNPGAFDLTELGVYDDGVNANFVVTLAGDVANPWGGNQISVQRFDLYLRAGSGSDPVAALPGTNAQLAAPYDLVVTADGFNDLGVRDAAGATVSSASLLALPATQQVVVSVPLSGLGSFDLSGAEYAITMMSHAGDGEGTGHVRPVYDREYWESTEGTDMAWIKEFRFGGGAGEYDGAVDSRDTDTSDPNVIDVLVPTGSTQADVLDWTAGAPVTLPYVPLE